jgi:RND family efflux transporter MFP subunit
VVAALLAGTVACRPEAADKPVPVEADRPVAVRQGRVEERVVGASWILQGQVQAGREWRALARVGGRVVRMAPEWGRLEAGGIVARLAAPEVEGQLAQARAALATAEAGRATADANLRQARDLARRTRDLAEGEVTSEQARSQARTMVEVAEAQAAQARSACAQSAGVLRTVQAQVNETIVRMPAAGVVAQRLVEPGAVVMPGQPLAVVVEDGRIHVRVALPEQAAGAIAVGDKAVFEAVAFAGRRFPGRVTALGPVLDPMTHTRPVRIEPAGDHPLRPGMSVEVHLRGQERKALVVPLAAVITSKGEDAVFVVEGGKARHRGVTTGWRDARWVELARGVAVGTAVVTEGADFVKDGDAVRSGTDR